jgi:hypothetical protein
MHFRLSFENAIHDELVPELEKSAAFASPSLKTFHVAPDRRSADVECLDGAEGEVTEKVLKLARVMVGTFRSMGDPEELDRSVRRDEGPLARDAPTELERRKWIRPLGRGQVALAGGACALKHLFDHDIRNLACRSFAAQEEDYPALLDPEVLARSGYFASFPHSVCFASHLTPDFDAIEAFRSANTDSDSLRIPEPTALDSFDAALRPAVCLPIYRALEDTTLPPGGITITTTGKAFRYESSNFDGLRRLWDFEMREIVLVAPRPVVEECRARFVDAVLSLMGAWDLGCRIVSASDPFFATVRGTKTLWQRSRALKYEVVVDIGGSALAVGSINLPEALFGQAFRIRDDSGETANTACLGFGLERLVLAAFSQHGFEPSRWPAPMRELVFG